MSYAGAVETYRKNAVLTASPEKIVQLLYEGAIRHLERARTAMQEPATARSSDVGVWLSKALGIISELRTALDGATGGDLAAQLDRLYEFAIDRVSEANIRRESEPLDSALHVLRTLKEGWDGVIAG